MTINDEIKTDHWDRDWETAACNKKFFYSL